MQQATVPQGLSVPKTRRGMAEQWLSWFLERLCQHRFSWPQTGGHGQDYQVCVICGATYNYDWATMRRTGRVARPLDQ
jgi:hypothetical protein